MARRGEMEWGGEGGGGGRVVDELREFQDEMGSECESLALPQRQRLGRSVGVGEGNTPRG